MEDVRQFLRIRNFGVATQLMNDPAKGWIVDGVEWNEA
jgi:hypothetical protein